MFVLMIIFYSGVRTSTTPASIRQLTKIVAMSIPPTPKFTNS